MAVVACVLSAAQSFAEDSKYDPEQNYEPQILGETLIIKGQIDSHITDFLEAHADQLRTIRVVDLNSLGGAYGPALEIAQKVKSLHVTTQLTGPAVCASSCVLIFASGEERLAPPGTRFGIHSLRVSPRFKEKFETACVQNDQLNEKLESCSALIGSWKHQILLKTMDVFAYLQSNGVSERLRIDYFSLEDDPDWQEELNVLKKPDLVLTTDEAYQYHLVTRLPASLNVSLYEQ